METLSVIVPVYNSREYLETCVTSVIAVNSHCSKVFVREIILVDDGSTDGSSELCDEIALIRGADDCMIRVIHQENRGVSSARNTGIREAEGSFLLFMDSDDTLDSERLAEIMQSLATSTTVDMVVFGLSFDYYSNERIYRQDTMLPPIGGIKSVDECETMLYNLFRTNMMSPLWNKLIRKSVVEKAGAFLRDDMFLYEDLEFSLRVLKQCGKIQFCTVPVYHYRQTQDEGNVGRRLKRITHIPEIVDKIETVLAPFGEKNDILLSLYFVLAREKIGIASKVETDAVCSDFREWIDARKLNDRIKNSKYGMMLYRGRSIKLIFKRNIARVRHRIAIKVKQTIGDFRNS